ncbi:hypothetical protein SGRA_1368 [Saprospira grandis str. Lewin]|uniref:Uncharacterized protein n=1 Tax=Saprospira grandis (strain Lewin) TaxID=984262 RepID=H6L6G1_SAPGL|nr:hypothetical protein SGRA_1368 [Saprospira grandis str. Lewin]
MLGMEQLPLPLLPLQQELAQQLLQTFAMTMVMPELLLLGSGLTMFHLLPLLEVHLIVMLMVMVSPML